MKKLLPLLAVLVMLSGVAYAGYDLSTKKIDDIEVMVVDETVAGDYLQVWRTTDGVEASEFLPLTAVSGFEDTTAANVLTTAECGKTLLLNSATEFATTLPAPTAGCEFHFIIKAAPAGADYTIVTTGAETIIGGANELEVDTGDDGPYTAGADTISFRSGTGDPPNTAAVGDWANLFSDGTSWYVSAQSRLDGAITFTSAIN